MNEFDIPTEPVIFRGSENDQDVAKHFVDDIVEVGKKIEKLLKTNIKMIMTDEDTVKHLTCKQCNLCKTDVNINTSVRDHCHLTGKFRQTLCSRCNLELNQPKFLPCFLHNLSNYDSHFIVTELGYDTKSITVIPNSEEKFISFSKYISNDFTIRFIDTFRFMSSSLSKLAENLITTDLTKFRETGKHFRTIDMPLVTRKGVYAYEYTDSWGKLEEKKLAEKIEFYSSLTESGIKDEEYEHAKEVWRHFR